MSSVVPDPAVTDWVPLGYGAAIQTNVPSARAWRSTAQSIASGTWTPLSFDSERWDTDNIFDVANPTRFTCRTSGKYLANFTVGVASNATGVREWAIRVNGSTYHGLVLTPAASGAGTYGGATVVLDLTVGDYVEFVAYQTSGISLTLLAEALYSPEASISFLGPGLLGRGVQNITGTYLTRPAANTVPPGSTYFAVDSLGTWLSDGSQWFLIAQRPAYGAPSLLGLAPWTTPYEGMEVLLTDSYATPSFAWHFRYNSQSASTYKWECIGGDPYVNTQPTTQTLAQTSVWTNISANAFSIQRAGEYLVNCASAMLSGAAGATTYLGVYANTPGNNYVNALFTHANTGYWFQLASAKVKVAIAAGVSIGLCAYGPASTQVSGGGNSFEVLPVRIQ
jgi:hypothetical protein